MGPCVTLPATRCLGGSGRATNFQLTCRKVCGLLSSLRYCAHGAGDPPLLPQPDLCSYAGSGKSVKQHPSKQARKKKDGMSNASLPLGSPSVAATFHISDQHSTRSYRRSVRNRLISLKSRYQVPSSSQVPPFYLSPSRPTFCNNFFSPCFCLLCVLLPRS